MRRLSKVFSELEMKVHFHHVLNAKWTVSRTSEFILDFVNRNELNTPTTKSIPLPVHDQFRYHSFEFS